MGRIPEGTEEVTDEKPIKEAEDIPFTPGEPEDSGKSNDDTDADLIPDESE